MTDSYTDKGNSYLLLDVRLTYLKLIDDLLIPDVFKIS